MNDDHRCAFRRVAAVCAALIAEQVRIAVVRDLAADEEFGEVTLLTSDPDIELVDISTNNRGTASDR